MRTIRLPEGRRRHRRAGKWIGSNNSITVAAATAMIDYRRTSDGGGRHSNDPGVVIPRTTATTESRYKLRTRIRTYRVFKHV